MALVIIGIVLMCIVGGLSVLMFYSKELDLKGRTSRLCLLAWFCFIIIGAICIDRGFYTMKSNAVECGITGNYNVYTSTVNGDIKSLTYKPIRIRK